MPIRIITLVMFLLGTLVSGAEQLSAPVIPGLHGKHPLSEAQVGEVLISELRCASCHEGLNGVGMKAAPELLGIGARVLPDYLERFIADPAGVHPGTTMPSLLAAVPEDERAEISKSITHYLLSLRGDGPSESKGPKADADTGRELFHGVGCVACHSPRNEGGEEIVAPGDISLAHLPGKHRPGALADFLHEPLKVRPSGRMPEMNLSEEESASLARYLEGAANAVVPESPAPTAKQIRDGKEAFEKFNCMACHQTNEAAAVKFGPPRSKLDPMAGCLSANPSKAPDFHLEESQRMAIRAALLMKEPSSAPSDQIKKRLTQLNCIACHSRDDYGGVSEGRDSFFHSSEEALGNEARIPPPLTLVGAKLKPEWLNKVLFDRESIRPYMRTRMPQFGVASLAGLPALFAEVDKMEEVVLLPPDRESGPKIRNGAHLLLGNKGLNCIACHNFNGKESPGMKGLDLMTSYQRLQPSWFHHFMKNPGAFRPGIIMPSYWPDGKAAQTEILDGDTELQLRALWHNFSLGRSARDPSGLRSEPSKLQVTDQPRTYRGRSDIAGYRGIAVGFPGGLNYAFNAQNGTLSAIWEGDFVSVGWQSQGSGNFKPMGNPVTLAQDVAFLQWEDDPGPWPLRPIRTKENPINPDPRYPRQHGYAFKGYSFDEASIPTFRYLCGDLAIEDKTVTAEVAGKSVLRRTFQFTSSTPEIVYFRALTGAIKTESATVFKTAALGMVLAPGETLLRSSQDPEGGQELLIKLTVPKGASTYTIEYELLQ